jgi:5-methyltetrahydrofolate--homocysteine methyltransferase
MSRFLDALRSGRVLLMDGAMGSELRQAGLGDGDCGEAWNLTHPERVASVHRAYVDAGAEVLLTNTFQAHWDALRRFGLENQYEPIFRAGNRIALDAAGGDRFVLGDTGPIIDRNTGQEFPHPRVIGWVVRCTVRIYALLIETCSSPRVRYALPYASGRVPVLLSLTYMKRPGEGFRTFSGHPPSWFAQRAGKWGVAALGVNCGREITVRDCAEIIRRYRDHTDLPLFARPNAGTPTRVGDRWVYPRSPDRMAEELPELLEAGVSMVGGCCGTTPEHIAAFRRVVDVWNVNKPVSRG